MKNTRGLLTISYKGHWAIENVQVTAEIYTYHYGKIGGKIILLDGSYIDFSEQVKITGNQVTKVRYRFQ